MVSHKENLRKTLALQHLGRYWNDSRLYLVNVELCETMDVQEKILTTSYVLDTIVCTKLFRDYNNIQ